MTKMPTSPYTLLKTRYIYNASWKITFWQWKIVEFYDGENRSTLFKDRKILAALQNWPLQQQFKLAITTAI